MGNAVETCFPAMCASLAITLSSSSSWRKFMFVSMLSYLLWKMKSGLPTPSTVMSSIWVSLMTPSMMPNPTRSLSAK